jgi:hypothetical protein
MVWVLNALDFKLDIRNQGDYVTFRWKYPHKTWWDSGRQLFFDIGNQMLLKIHNLYDNVPCGGSGTIVSYQDFVETYSRVPPGQTLCCKCNMAFPTRHLRETGMYEYATLDLDCGQFICDDCYEWMCDDRTPDDPSLFDGLTPVSVGSSF